MLLFTSVLLGLIVGFLRKGKVSEIFNKKIKLLPLGLVGVAIQIVVHLSYYFEQLQSISSFIPVIYFVSYIFILLTLIFNLDDLGSIMIAVGLTTDFIVTFMNGGKMPVADLIVKTLPQSVFQQSILNGTNTIYLTIQPAATSLWFMGVNIPIPYVGFFTSFYGGIPGISVGGIAVILGVILWVQYLMVPQKLTNLEVTEVLSDENISSVSSIISEEVQEIDANREEIIQNAQEVEDICDVKSEIEVEAQQETKVIADNPIIVVDKAADDLDLTKVFPSILNEENTEQKEAVIEDTIENSKKTEGSESAATSGFFTQNFYAEKEKQATAKEIKKLKQELNWTDANNEAKVTDTKNNELEEKVVFEEPSVDVALNNKEANTSDISERYILVNEPKEKNMKQTKISGHNEEEMLSVWQKLNLENERRKKAQRRRRSNFSDSSDPFRAEREKRAAAEAVARANAHEKALQEEKNKPIFREVTELEKRSGNTQPVSPLPKIHDKPIEKFSMTEEALKESIVTKSVPSDEDRIKAGYEKVELSIEGKDVIFWRKKKA